VKVEGDRHMLKPLRVLNDNLVLFGIDIKKLARSMRGLPPYVRSLREMKNRSRGTVNLFPIRRLYPCLEDRFAESGSANGHYYHQDLLIARRIFASQPERHVDIGSRIDGFVAHVASFRVIEVMDIRQLTNKSPNIRFIQCDLMNRVAECFVDYCDSISSLHAIEHFGLGRYGDRIDPEGYLLGLNNIHKILRKKGRFYFSVPIGPQRVEFNAHRVFGMKYLSQLLREKYYIDDFSFVDDRGDLHENAALAENIENDCGCNFGCGIFELTKR
jgi:SAM-dependent methyltransferase